MKARTIRVEDELWEEATREAQTLGVSVSDLIRQALSRVTASEYLIRQMTGSETVIMGGQIVLSGWDKADPEVHRFHMLNCDVELKGLDLWVTPREDVFPPREDHPASTIYGCNFKPWGQLRPATD